MSPNPSLPSFFRDLANLLRALSEAIFVWPIFLSHHLWHSLTLASPSGSLTPVGPPTTHTGLDKPMLGHLGSENRRSPRRTSRARTRGDSSSAGKVRRDLTPTPTTRSRGSSSSSTPSQDGDRDATPTPALSRSGGDDDLRSRLAPKNFTNVTHSRIASQPTPNSPPMTRKAKHARHFSASTDGTFSSSEPDSVRGNSAGSSRSSSFSSESSYSSLFEEPTTARTAHFRPHSFGLSNPDLGSDTESGGYASTAHGDDARRPLGELLKLGEAWEAKKREREGRRKEWEQQRLVDAIERLQVSLLTAEEKEKEKGDASPGTVSSPLLEKANAPVLTVGVRSPPKPTLRIQSPPSITIVPPPPQVYDSDMDDDDEEDMTPTPTVENAMPPFRPHHPQPSSNSSPIFINPFAPPGSTSASASSSTITLTSHNTSPTATTSSSPKPPSPKGSPSRLTLKFLPGRDEKRSTSPSRLPTLPSMKKLFKGHRGGKTRSHGRTTSDEGAVAAH